MKTTMRKLFLFLLFICSVGIANTQVKDNINDEIFEKRRIESMKASRVNSRPATPNAGSIHVNRNGTYVAYTPKQMVEEIFIKTGGGACATEGVIENVVLRDAAWNGTSWISETTRSLSYFSNGAAGLGMTDGLLLTTGGGLLAEGPNQQSGHLGGAGVSLTGDTDLTPLLGAGQTVQTGAVLEFDFTPQQSKVSFDYIFASEEYPEYVNNTVNDVFGFFITDLTTGVKQNIALIPGTNTPVSINTVNGGYTSTNTAAGYLSAQNPSNSAYFVPNYDGGNYMEYDGRTTILTASANVVPGRKYRMKLAVANVGDKIYGSGVFLKAGSFDLGLGIINHGNNIENMDNVFQNCTNNKFSVTINKRSTPTTVSMTYAGAAVNDIRKPDGTALPATITFPANVTKVDIPYKVLNTVTANGGAFNITANIPGCGESKKTLKVYNRFTSPSVVTTAACSGNDGTAYVTVTGGTADMEMSKDNGATWQKIATKFTGLAPGNYSIKVRDKGSCQEETLTATIYGKPTITTALSNQSVCVGTTIAKIDLTGPIAGTTYSWTVSNAAVGLSNGSGASIPAFVTKNTTAVAISTTVTVTPTAAGCVGTPKSFTITVNPLPVLTQPGNQTVCANSNTAAVIFAGSNVDAATSTWTNNNIAIGLAASGTGSIAIFNAKNTTANAITATITVTPKSAAGCVGTAKTFTITVNPSPVLTQPGNQTVCANSNTAAIIFAGANVNAATSTWTNNNAAIGLAASGTGNIVAFNAKNTTANAITATITVTPKSGAGCVGTAKTFTITVNPSPVLTQPGNQTVCANSNTAAVIFAGSNVDAATSTWTNNNTAIGLAASGTGNIAVFNAKNTTANAITATITVTPKSGAGCVGTAKTFTITVNPSPVLTQPGNQTVCANSNTAAIIFAGANVNAATSIWTNNNTAIGLVASGTGNIVAFNAKNTTTAPITATITVTPKSAAGCVGIATTFTITVNPLGRPADITAADATICYNTKATLTASSTLAGAQFKWYDTQTSTVVLANTASYTSPANLTASRSYYVSVTATGVCENPTSARKEVKVTVRPQIVVGTISGNPSVCSGDVPQEIKGAASTGGSGLFDYKWESKVGAGAWTVIAAATTTSYQPAALTQTTLYRRTTIDKTCGEAATKSNEFTITVVGQGVKFTWKTNAANSNWNDPANWTNSEGLANAVPTTCSEVHIPYIASTAIPCNYPSLDDTTPTNIFGEPSAGSIIFHHGGQIAFPHKLNYKKAFVQYNWKYYNNTGLTVGAQPGVNSDALGSFLKRDVWNMIAAPLKGMASGDFALGGYPMSWQSKFKATTTPTAGVTILGDFSNPIRDNNIDLSSTYNAIAVMVPAHKTAIGYNQQNTKGMEGLRGILEMPYWENTSVAAFRSGHFYDPIAKKSMFHYFDEKTLQQLGSPVGMMPRDDKSYRFIFEDANNNVPAIPELANVKGYTITVQPEEKGVVMIGNPFLSSINSQKFFDANSASINKAKGYYVFAPDGLKWAQYQYNSNNNVGPLQAFVVTLTNTTSAVKLFFPLEGTHALTGKDYKRSSRIAPENGSLLVSLNSGQATADDSYAILDNSSESGNVNKILFTEGHKTPEVFFISPNSNEYNLVQTLNTDKELNLGVRSSDTNSELTLNFDNIGQFVVSNGMRPVLIDKVSGRKQDLSVYNTYKFRQEKDRLDASHTDADRFEIRLMGDEDFSEDRSIIVRYFKKELTVESMSNLKEISIYDLAGNKIFQIRNGLENINFYQKDLSLSQGVYIVNALTADGRKKTEKIIVHN